MSRFRRRSQRLHVARCLRCGHLIAAAKQQQFAEGGSGIASLRSEIAYVQRAAFGIEKAKYKRKSCASLQAAFGKIRADVGEGRIAFAYSATSHGYLLAPRRTRMPVDEKADGKCSPAVLGMYLPNVLYAVTQHSCAAAHRN